MTAAERLAGIKARVDILPAETWHAGGTCVAAAIDSCNCGAGADLYAHERHCGLDLVAEIGHEGLAEFISGARQDVPAMLAALTAVLELIESQRRPSPRTATPWSKCRGFFADELHAAIESHLSPAAGGRSSTPPTSPAADTTRPHRYDQCDATCTTDCGHCKGEGPPKTEGASA